MEGLNPKLVSFLPFRAHSADALTPAAGNDSVDAGRAVEMNTRKDHKIVSFRVAASLLILAAAGTIFADDLILPDGKGRDAVENACTVCHTPDRIMRQSLTADQWRSEVRTMVENGASLNPDEWEPVVAYLTKNFGPRVDVNKASAQEMETGLQLSPQEAEAILAYRIANGAFKDLKDLQKVPGVDAKKLAAKENRIAF
jgi:competence ComEA-like helix-hairpin-helix protein